MRQSRGSLVVVMTLASLAAAGAFAADAVQDRNRMEALAHYRAGEEARRGEDWPAAEREYRAAIQLDPLLTLAHYRLGQTYISPAKLGEAYNNLAVVYMLTGRFDEAEKAVPEAEKAGFKVNPQLKKDIAARKARG